MLLTEVYERLHYFSYMVHKKSFACKNQQIDYSCLINHLQVTRCIKSHRCFGMVCFKTLSKAKINLAFWTIFMDFCILFLRTSLGTNDASSTLFFRSKILANQAWFTATSLPAFFVLQILRAMRRRL